EIEFVRLVSQWPASGIRVRLRIVWGSAVRVVRIALQLSLQGRGQTGIPSGDEAPVGLRPAVRKATRIDNGHLRARACRADVPDLSGFVKVDVAPAEGVAGPACIDRLDRYGHCRAGVNGEWAFRER